MKTTYRLELIVVREDFREPTDDPNLVLSLEHEQCVILKESENPDEIYQLSQSLAFLANVE